MGSVRRRVLASVLLVCGVACGGQSGQPAVGHEEVRCQVLEFDQPGFGPSPQEVLERFPEQRDIPLYWMEGAMEDDLFSREQDDARSTTRMNMKLDYDASRESKECGSSTVVGAEPDSITLQVPVQVVVSTEDGMNAAFEATLDYDSGPNPAVPLFESPRELYFDWWPEHDHFNGKLYDAERGLAVWPVPCGGIAQRALSEEPNSNIPSAATILAPLLEQTLHFPAASDSSEAPAIDLTLALNDQTACYDAPRAFIVDLDVTVETGGATFTETVPARVSGTFNGMGTTDDKQWHVMLDWNDLCGDVSNSADWKKLSDTESQRVLCVGMEVQLWNGPASLSAEAKWDHGTRAWGFWNGVKTY